MRDIYSELAVDQLLDPAAVTADANSSALDLQDYDSNLLIANVGATGDILDASNDINLEVEEAPDNGSGSPGSWTDVADADLEKYVNGANDGTFAHIDAAAEDDAVYITSYKGSKRFVRVVVNVTGTHTNGTPISVTGIRGHARSRPVNERT